MERVAFLLEDSGQRLPCMLNPESLVQRRRAGVRPSRSAGGLLTGARMADDPLLYTGGGTTELELELLFDVSIADSPVPIPDVRDLTRPLWELSENGVGEDGFGRPPTVRFVWGTSWNIRGVVVAVAERLECFTPEGSPGRSWLRMRLQRVAEASDRPEIPASVPSTLQVPPPETEIPPEQLQVHEVLGGSGGESGSGLSERLDVIARRYYSNPLFWKHLALFNNVDDPTHIPSGLTLRIPPLSMLKQSP